MIQIEGLRRFRKVDLLTIIILALLCSAITSFINISNNQLTFILSLLITTIFMTFTALLINRVGAVTLFYLLCALITFRVNNLIILGWDKVIILGTAGIIFELFFILIELQIKNIPLGVIMGAAFSNISIPFTMVLLTKPTEEMVPHFKNFALMTFVIGLIGSIAMFLIWYNIKGKKFIIKYQYST